MAPSTLATVSVAPRENWLTGLRAYPSIGAPSAGVTPGAVNGVLGLRSRNCTVSLPLKPNGWFGRKLNSPNTAVPPTTPLRLMPNRRMSSGYTEL
ncbi:hypothetical protein D3C77_355200 [compost metagenome]